MVIDLNSLTIVTIECLYETIGVDLPLPVVLHLDHERHGSVLVRVPVTHSSSHVQADPPRFGTISNNGIQHYLEK